MQEHYLGDVHDFMKYALPRSLPATYQSCPVVSRIRARPGKRTAVDTAPATPSRIVRRKP